MCQRRGASEVAANRERFCDSSSNAAIRNQRGADDWAVYLDERAVHPAPRQAQARRRNAKRAARLHRAFQRVGAAPQVRGGGATRTRAARRAAWAVLPCRSQSCFRRWARLCLGRFSWLKKNRSQQPIRVGRDGGWTGVERRAHQVMACPYWAGGLHVQFP